MKTAWTAEQVRQAEEPLIRVSGLALMKQAARLVANAALAEIKSIRGRVYGSSAVLLVGPGNNGGDALFAGAQLAARGVSVKAVPVLHRVHPEGLVEFQSQGGLLLPGDLASAQFVLSDADVVIDGVFGSGGKPVLSGLVGELAQALGVMREEGTVPRIVAVDVPSGVDASTGRAGIPAVFADITVTLGGAKTGLYISDGPDHAGSVVLGDIGLLPELHKRSSPDVQCLEAADVAEHWQRPGAGDHKYTRGVLGVVTGSTQYPGAGVLSVSAAVHTGVGMVRYLGADSVSDLIHHYRPEMVAGPGKVQAWLVGSGISNDNPEHAEAIGTALYSGLPAVLDAGALDVLARAVVRNGFHGHPAVVLTPHAGELSGFLSALELPVSRQEIEVAPLQYARATASETGCTVVLKGHNTVIAAPDGTAYVQSGSSSWLATAGSGDVLAGIVAAIIAGAAEREDFYPARSAASGVFVHSLAGELASGGGPITALGLAEQVPHALRQILSLG